MTSRFPKHLFSTPERVLLNTLNDNGPMTLAAICELTGLVGHVAYDVAVELAFSGEITAAYNGGESLYSIGPNA